MKNKEIILKIIRNVIKEVFEDIEENYLIENKSLLLENSTNNRLYAQIFAGAGAGLAFAGNRTANPKARITFGGLESLMYLLAAYYYSQKALEYEGGGVIVNTNDGVDYSKATMSAYYQLLAFGYYFASILVISVTGVSSIAGTISSSFAGTYTNILGATTPDQAINLFKSYATKYAPTIGLEISGKSIATKIAQNKAASSAAPIVVNVFDLDSGAVTKQFTIEAVEVNNLDVNMAPFEELNIQVLTQSNDITIIPGTVYINDGSNQMVRQTGSNVVGDIKENEIMVLGLGDISNDVVNEMKGATISPTIAGELDDNIYNIGENTPLGLIAATADNRTEIVDQLYQIIETSNQSGNLNSDIFETFLKENNINLTKKQIEDAKNAISKEDLAQFFETFDNSVKANVQKSSKQGEESVSGTVKTSETSSKNLLAKSATDAAEKLDVGIPNPSTGRTRVINARLDDLSTMFSRRFANGQLGPAQFTNMQKMLSDVVVGEEITVICILSDGLPITKTYEVKSVNSLGIAQLVDASQTSTNHRQILSGFYDGPAVKPSNIADMGLVQLKQEVQSNCFLAYQRTTTSGAGNTKNLTVNIEPKLEANKSGRYNIEDYRSKILEYNIHLKEKLDQNLLKPVDYAAIESKNAERIATLEEYNKRVGELTKAKKDAIEDLKSDQLFIDVMKVETLQKKVDEAIKGTPVYDDFAQTRAALGKEESLYKDVAKNNPGRFYFKSIYDNRNISLILYQMLIEFGGGRVTSYDVPFLDVDVLFGGTLQTNEASYRGSVGSDISVGLDTISGKDIEDELDKTFPVTP